MKVCIINTLVYEWCDYLHTFASNCVLMSWYRFHYLLYCFWISYYNDYNLYIGYIYFRECFVIWGIFCWWCNTWKFVMLTITDNDTNWSTFWRKFYCYLKCFIFDEWVVWEINYWRWNCRDICASYQLRTRWPSLAKFIFMFIKFGIWVVFEFIGKWIPTFQHWSAVSITHLWYFLCFII